METMTLSLIFAASMAVSCALLLTFARSIDDALSRVLPAELAPAWSLYAKFALFAASLAGGLRLLDLGGLAARGGPPMEASRSLLEVYKSVAGGLGAGAWLLLVVFGACLAGHLGLTLYARGQARRREEAKPEEPPKREETRRAEPAGRR